MRKKEDMVPKKIKKPDKGYIGEVKPPDIKLAPVVPAYLTMKQIKIKLPPKPKKTLADVKKEEVDAAKAAKLKAKEAKVGEGVPETWGDWERRAINWEIVTATALVESGADILVLRHPESVKAVKAAIDDLMAG